MILKTKLAKKFLALGIALISSALGSPIIFEKVLNNEFPQQFWYFNGLIITLGVVLLYSGIKNVWVNARNH